MKKKIIDDEVLYSYLNLPEDFNQFTKAELLDLIPDNCGYISSYWNKDRIIQKLEELRYYAWEFYNKEVNNLSNIGVGTPLLSTGSQQKPYIVLVADWRFSFDDYDKFKLSLKIFEINFELQAHTNKFHPGSNGWITYDSDRYIVLEEVVWTNPDYISQIKPILLEFLQNYLPG